MSQFGKNRGSNNWIGYAERPLPGTPKGHGRVIPREALRKMAMASTEGGTAKCHYCKATFATHYVALCQVDSFTQDWVCYDCRKPRQLERVK